MKTFYSFLSAAVCFLLLSFVCPVNLAKTSPATVVACANPSDLAKADSIAPDAIKVIDNQPGKVIALDRELTDEEINEINSFIPVKVLNPAGETPSTASEIIKAILSLIGGLLTSIILYFLHKRWPDIFTSQKLKDYKNPPEDKA